MWGIDDLTCYKCRADYETEQKILPCEDGEKLCRITQSPHTRLTYDEQQILDDMYDFLNTGEIMSRDREYRQEIILLTAKYKEFVKQKENPECLKAKSD